MDGYAVRAEDLKNASAQAPVALRLNGEVSAGSVFSGEVGSGQCVRLFTGAPLPHGADAVIMQEDTQPNASEPDRPRMLDAVKPWENVRFKGEDTKQGALMALAGERLTVTKIGLLSALGLSTVRAARAPVLGLLATGSELKEAGQALSPGQIYESNRITLALLASTSGGGPKIYPLVPDDLVATQSALAQAFAECDAVLTTGGVSVGQTDLVKPAFAQLGGELDFWRVAIKPGKPFALGKWQGKLLFGLPGNPVSAFVTFLLLIRPALLGLQGATDLQLPSVSGVLAEPLVNSGDRRHFVRVSCNPSGQVVASGPQASHRLHSLAQATGLVDVPANTTLPLGALVPILTWGN